MINNLKKKMPRFSRFPFVWLLIALWAASRYFDWGTGIGSTMGVALMLLSFGVMALEFFKAADIGLNTFRIELASAISCLLAMSISITYIVINNGLSGLHLGDYIVAAITLIDAWLSPSACFAMALRNLQGGVSPQSGSDDADAS